MARFTGLARACGSLTLVGVVGLAACGPSNHAEPLLGSQSRTLKAPPKPGSSISHTKMCECQACDPSACCAGDIGEQSNANAVCKDSYDFTKEGCGLSVSSCTSRCARHVWRIRLDEDCQASTPLICCSG
jgi:hypothetical protein